MSFDAGQFRQFVAETLTDYDVALHSRAAVNLLLGTAAVESRLGSFLWQVGGGPALGIYQMEPATFIWLRGKFADRYYLNGRPPENMVFDLRFATLLARLRYRVVPAPLPQYDDIEALAAYWKKHYNTPAGAGTVAKFVTAYATFVGET